MKKLTTSVLAVVLTSSFALVNAQVDTTKTQDIEGVVVTALGIKRERKSIGYAAQEVKGDAISDAGQSNAVSALSGNIAGVQVTAPSSMGGINSHNDEGISSIIGENRPLIVVDGVPLDNSNINDVNTQRGAGGRDYGDASFDINPDDIESVTVLKGGPAAALYGSRASNGVIIYTTKQAKKGRASIEFNTGVAFESIYIRPKLQNYYGGGSQNTLPTATINGETYNINEYRMDESWGPRYDPNLMYLPWYAFDQEFSNDYLKLVPWVAPKKDVDSFFDTGITFTNNLSVSKSFDKSNLRMSYTNTDIAGIVPTSTIKRNNFSINANSELSSRLKAETVINFVQTVGFNRPEQGYGDNSVAQKFYQWGQRQLDFSKLKDYILADGSQRSWNRTSWDDGTPYYSDNPYWTIYENVTNDKRNRFYGNVGLTYTILPSLYAVGKIYADVYSQQNDARVAIGSQAVSGFSVFNRNFTEFNYEGRVHWNPKISESVSLQAFAGVNRRNLKRSDFNGTTRGGLVIPNFYNLKNSVNDPLATNEVYEKRVNSAFGSVSLGFKDIIFIEGTGRNDWFSTTKFDKFYPSITGSFVFSNLIKANWLSFGKIRAGWANIASDTDPYQLANFAVQTTNFNNMPRYSLSTRNNNPELKAELKETVEYGIEANFFKNRIGFDFTYYDVNITDAILPLTVDPATGFRTNLINAGRINNKGVEIMAFVTPIKTTNFTWSLNWNFAQNKNKIVELYQDLETYQLTNAPFRARLLAEVGQPYGTIWGTDFTYDANGNKIVDENGFYVPSAIKNLGSTLPDYNMGLRNTIKYKNLSLSFLFDMQQGGKYYSTSHMWGMYSGMLEETGFDGNREAGIVLDGVFENGTPNNVRITAAEYGGMHYGNVDRLNVFDASYIKLRDITLGYDLPKSLIGNFLEGVRISAFGRNLFAWNLDWKGIDPENTSYGSGNIQGLEGARYHQQDNMDLMLTLNFNRLMKNFKKFTYSLSKVLALAIILISCTQDFDEINNNPNNPESPLTYGLFNSANRQVTDATRNSFESGRVTLPWVQYSAQTAYNDEDKYAYRLTSGDALWGNLYIAASNYKKIIDMNVDPETASSVSAYGANANQIAASRVMLSYIFLNLVDTFGDIPYYSYGNSDPDFQALQVNEFLKPKFASQQKVYADILKELKESAEMIELDAPVFIPADGLFGGNALKLKKFANSLRLRVATRVKGVVSGAETHISEAIASGVMTSNADNVGVTYENNLTNPSPMYNDFRTRSDFSVSKTFIDLLKGTNGNFGVDPRLFKYATPIGTPKAQILNGSYVESTDLTKYVGQPYGLPEDWQASQADKANFFSKEVYKPNYQEILMEYSEVEFLLSEANGWNQTNYENGVRASMQKWGVTAGSINSFIATLPSASAETVLTQKYVALYMQPYEAWSEYRRTGYPNTSILLLPGETYALNNPIPNTGETTYTFNPLVAGLTDLPARLFYPTVIQTLNRENYQAAASAIGGDAMSTKLIFDN